uniref:Secreted protein n=1 Tax=Ursus americanus TaxID=9643 RepID=A0A452Q9J6_URSAM
MPRGGLALAFFFSPSVGPLGLSVGAPRPAQTLTDSRCWGPAAGRVARLSGRGGPPIGTAVTRLPRFASLSLHCLHRIVNVKKQSVCFMSMKTAGTLGNPGSPDETT